MPESNVMIIRYSMIDAFIQCPILFRDRYVLNKPDTSLKSSALEYGTALHLAIKTHFEQEDGVAVFNLYWDSLKDTPMQYYRHSWQELKDLANERFLKNFFKTHANKFTKIQMEETIIRHADICASGVEFQGTFDMAAEYDGKLTIADWKTSTREYDKDKIERNPQLYLYAWLYEQKYEKLPQQLIYKVFIKSEGRIQTLKTDLTEKKLDLQMENISSIVNSMLQMIKENDFYCNYSNPYCNCKLEAK